MQTTMRSISILAAIWLVGCGDGGGDSRPSSRPGVSTQARCANSIREGAEVCDGVALGGMTCESVGLGAGSLACAPDCTEFDTSGCGGGCTMECGNRVCGPDPQCGLSCGTCSDGSCTANGQCEASNPGAPRILSLSTNVTSITVGESITVTAVVTDPDGIDDVIGGTLSSPLGATYGPFVTSAQEGAYSATLGWNEMDQVETVQFQTEAVRSLVVTFFDVQGNQTTDTVSITLHCNGTGACDGACVDLLDSNQHCGTCSNDCSDILPAPPDHTRSCYLGQCGFVVGVVASHGHGEQRSCIERCESQNSSCGMLDWRSWTDQRDNPMPCGLSVGCFYYSGSEDERCIDSLSCGDIGTQQDGCGEFYTDYCFCQ